MNSAAGIGIDLLEINRAQVFLKEHQSNVGRLLSDNERKYWKKKKMSAPQFARLFAAKEAFFKARNASWLGLDGFAQIEVKWSSGTQFRVKTCPENKKKVIEGSGTYFEDSRWVGAQVIVWHSKSKRPV